MARLTIPDEATFAEFTVVTSTSAFPISFSLFAKADITVLVDGVELDQADFTFSGTILDGGGYDGGTVTLNTAVDDVTVRIERNVSLARTSNFAPASAVPIQTVDLALNRLTAYAQDQKRREETNRAYLDAAIVEAGDELAMIGKADTDGNNLTRTLTDGVARAFGSKDVVSPLDYGASVTAAAIQLALTKGAALGLPVTIPPGSYALGTSTLSVPAGSVVLADGVTLTTTSNTTKFVTLAGSNITIRGLSLIGPEGGYNVLSYGFFATGTVNGAAVAPTYLSNITLIDCEATGFGRTGMEFDYVDGAKIVRPRLTSLGYSGVETLGSKRVVVIEPYIDGLTGETGSGELNAYGVTFSRNTGSSDTVRYPDSEHCKVIGGTIKNIPTWHGLDTHGGKYITFCDTVIYDCRRAVVLTNATHTVPSYCLVDNVRAFNTAAVGATNSNGSEKRAEAFWDVGLSDASPSLRNRFTNNYAFGYGGVTVNTGAYYFLHASGGEYLNNTDENSYIVGVRIDDSVTDFRLRGHVSRNCRAPASGGFNTSPVGYLVAGTSNSAADQSGIVENCRSVRDDTTVDTHVLALGFRVATGTGRAIKLRNNDFEAATPGVSLETADSGITGDLTRDHTLTVTGFDTTPTSVTVTATRNGPNVTLTFPLITGTSNSTGFTLSGLPTELYPAANRHFCVKIMDNGAVAFGLMIPASDGTFTIAKGADESASWTASGTKRLYPIAITYSISLPE